MGVGAKVITLQLFSTVALSAALDDVGFRQIDSVTFTGRHSRLKDHPYAEMAALLRTSVDTIGFAAASLQLVTTPRHHSSICQSLSGGLHAC